MKEYTKFDEKGAIVCYGSMQDEVFETTENILEGSYNDSEFYILNNNPVERPTLQLNKNILTANGIDTILATVPIPFTICIDGELYEISDGIFEFSTTIAGTYIIEAKTFPYKENPIEIIAI